MSVDFLVCTNCGETFPDCGYYISCKCGNCWCSDECASEDGFEDNNEDDEDKDEDEISCSFCRNEKFTDKELLAYAVEKLRTTIEELSAELLLKTKEE